MHGPLLLSLELSILTDSTKFNVNTCILSLAFQSREHVRFHADVCIRDDQATSNLFRSKIRRPLPTKAHAFMRLAKVVTIILAYILGHFNTRHRLTVLLFGI